MSVDGRYIVVGLDGSPESARALSWAAARTDRFGPIQPVTAWHYPWWAITPPTLGAPLPPPPQDLHAHHKRVVDALVARHVPVADRRETITVHGPAGPALVAAAEGASLLVVGSRGRGAVASSVLGSVSLHCVHHATVPVAVIPADGPTGDRLGRVVVGVDGSKSSIAALAWVLSNTDQQTRVEAFHAWQLGAAGLMSIDAANALAALEDLVEDVEPMAHDMLADAVILAKGQAGQPDRDVEATPRRGDARSLLRTASADSDLLVLGAQGHQGVAHLLLGSVATALIHHPSVPTIVVREG
jgi:nucleotide-binding universal stress UspA family protein